MSDYNIVNQGKEYRFLTTWRDSKAQAWLNFRNRMGFRLEWRDYTLFGVRYVVSRPLVEVPFPEDDMFMPEMEGVSA